MAARLAASADGLLSTADQQEGNTVTRDFKTLKIVLGAASAQILFARRAFPPDCFQLTPYIRHLERGSSLESIINSGNGLVDRDMKLLRNTETSVMFRRQSQNLAFNKFMDVLTADVFGMIRAGWLRKLQICFLSSKTWQEDCLTELYTILLQYHDDGKYQVDIRRAGLQKYSVSQTAEPLMDLGKYLSSLPVVQDRMYCTLFCSIAESARVLSNRWQIGRSQFDTAHHNLKQKPGYNETVVARLMVNPLSPPQGAVVIVIEDDSSSQSEGEQQLKKMKHPAADATLVPAQSRDKWQDNAIGVEVRIKDGKDSVNPRLLTKARPNSTNGTQKARPALQDKQPKTRPKEDKDASETELPPTQEWPRRSQNQGEPGLKRKRMGERYEAQNNGLPLQGDTQDEQDKDLLNRNLFGIGGLMLSSEAKSRRPSPGLTVSENMDETQKMAAASPVKQTVDISRVAPKERNARMSDLLLFHSSDDTEYP